jgi:transcription antitermination protein NusB
MKTAKDPRHLQRIKVMQEVYSWDFSQQNNLKEDTTKDIIKNLERIDQLIQKAATSWPLEKINKIDLAILRLATYELFIKKSVPEKVVVDEAVELGKEYGSDSSSSFINGALGKMIADNV